MSELNNVVIGGMARTPIGNFMGSLSDLSALELARVAGTEALKRANIEPENIDEVTMGMVFKHGLKGNPARQAQLMLGIPFKSSAVTIEQQCSSSMRALEIACQQIQLGRTAAALVLGAESMTNVPYMLLGAPKGYRIGAGSVEDAMYYDGLVDAFSDLSIMETAENVAKKYNVSRLEQDEYAYLSQSRALEAIQRGNFKDEIVPVEIKRRKGTILVDYDEHPRETTLEQLSSMKPAYMKDGTVTAGNSSGINDGACAAVVLSEKYAKELGIKPLVRILSTVTYGCDPKVMGIGPIYAIPAAAKAAGLSMGEIDYYEINEAFAAQAVPCIRELGIDIKNVNASGSGIALGHPVGMTGLRLIISGYYELKRRGKRYGCASLCAGGGPSMATVFECLG